VWEHGAEFTTYLYKDMFDSGVADGTPVNGTVAQENIVITKTDVDKAARVVAGFAGYVVPLVVAVSLIFGALFYMFGMVVFGFIGGLFVYTLARVAPALFSRVGAVPYMGAARAAIYAGVLPSIVMMVSWFTPVTITYGMYMLAMLVIVVVNVKGMAHK
jgi:hypothetical protein